MYSFFFSEYQVWQSFDSEFVGNCFGLKVGK